MCLSHIMISNISFPKQIITESFDITLQMCIRIRLEENVIPIWVLSDLFCLQVTSTSIHLSHSFYHLIKFTTAFLETPQRATSTSLHIPFTKFTSPIPFQLTSSTSTSTSTPALSDPPSTPRSQLPVTADTDESTIDVIATTPQIVQVTGKRYDYQLNFK